VSCTFGRCGLAVLKCELENQNFQARDSDSFPNEWRVYCEISKPAALQSLFIVSKASRVEQIW
jgi:hypothetical protein